MVYCEIHPFTIDDDKVRDFAPRGIILSGGPASVTEGTSPRAPGVVFRLGVPVLGICYGMQTMCDELGGRVAVSEHQEFGRAFVDILDDCLLFEGLWPKGGREQVWMSHGDRVDALPAGFRAVAASEAATFAAIADDSRRFYGFLFHPEVAHTARGAELLRNFIHKVAACHADWTMARFRAEAIEKIRRQVGTGGGVCGLSGGVDSAVAAALLHEAVGLLRAGEGEEVSSCSGATTTSRWSIATPASSFSPASPGPATPKISASGSAPPLSRSSTRRRRNWAMSSFWRMGRSIPT
jgi:GMP synthase (glutamine-hydrolysing)